MTKRRFWVISPNARNDGNVEYWLQKSDEERKVFVGYDSDKKHGTTFENTINIGDCVIIAKGARDDRKIYLAGIIISLRQYDDEKEIFYRKVDYLINEKDFDENSIQLNSDNAWGDSSNPGTIYEIKESNQFDRLVIDKITTVIKLKLEMRAIQERVELLRYKKQIILQGPPGTGKTYTAKDIAEHMIFGEVSKDKNLQKERLENSNKKEQFKLIQFHPAYSYEDFVRGITAKAVGASVTYYTEDKTLGKFAKLAAKNPFLENGGIDVEQSIKKFKDYVATEIEAGRTFSLNDSVYISKVDPEKFLYYGHDNEVSTPISFDELRCMIQHDPQKNEDLAGLECLSGVGRGRPTYHLKLYDKYRQFMSEFATKVIMPFVLVIDEINRANLPAVLGELIYALEYRGEQVESMYGIEGNNFLTLPKNLFIIGTMNTADRSVGHIDYAIRRRFAFVNIEPSSTIINEIVPEENGLKSKALKLFEDVASFFTIDKMASDFKAKDIQLGHSYFLVKTEHELSLKLEFEIKPLLKEYIKDGILLSVKNEKGMDLTELNVDNLKIG